MTIGVILTSSRQSANSLKEQNGNNKRGANAGQASERQQTKPASA